MYHLYVRIGTALPGAHVCEVVIVNPAPWMGVCEALLKPYDFLFVGYFRLLKYLPVFVVVLAGSVNLFWGGRVLV